ncbi:MAG TPA: thioredoxin domain-containing protein [Kofleriaceae bacterium]|jgi:protein-disulfide isomerase|nr:thioredoxin domain-containing protein [Kofleriaceae bacterium]
MYRFMLALALAAACQAHDPALEHKVDTLATQIAAMQHDVAALRAAVEHPAAPNELDAKVADLQRKLDTVARGMPRPRHPEPDPDRVYAVAVDGYASEGPADAKVTMVLAFDYADPYTEKTRDGRVEMRKKYGNDLRIVYRNFVVHPQVAKAPALGGCAANKQHKFTAFDAIAWTKGFDEESYDVDSSPECWETDAGCPIVLAFAKQAGITDLARFKRDMKACDAELEVDVHQMQQLGIHATPSFFINGRYIVGALPTETFEALVDAELAKANERIRAGAKAATYYKDWVLAKGLTRLEP